MRAGSFTMTKDDKLATWRPKWPRYPIIFIRQISRNFAAGLLLLPLAAAPLHAEPASSALAECAACHGEDGIGRDVEIPNLAGQSEVYLYRQLQHFKSGKRPHKEMRYESRQLSDQDMQALAHYYSQLAR